MMEMNGGAARSQPGRAGGRQGGGRGRNNVPQQPQFLHPGFLKDIVFLKFP